ncbi:MAG: TlpA family protein disulfide reductase [Melioribacteraceae bacterium]|nr:TlpA family protein disulfide reductase [Melioribacteraceae bacterium]MCF8265048.1 TlpA family protein disulfide reductase [Melioribacteraceae bacterium]MCF8414395.1 TlpA family protein disulfide reductase [Melioribacteraceae bacterium]MCF8430961.1 TlpA family protein disulfide reductase [Melioribacteraceae bacterium]
MRFNPAIIIFLLIISSCIFAQSSKDFTVEILDGEKQSFEEIYSEGPVLVNFWALWCTPCLAEMKALDQLYEKYQSQGFRILGINQDTPRSLAKIKTYISTREISYNIVLDPDKTLYEEFNAQILPTNILFNQKGEIVYQSTGYFPGDEFQLEEEIKKVLSKE